MAQDFNRVHRALRLMMAYSYADRPELATLLAKERFEFYRRMLLVEFRLTLHACGYEKMPEINLLRSLETLQAQLRALTPVMAGAAV